MAYTPVDTIGFKAWIKEYSRTYEAKLDLTNLGQPGNSFREGSILVLNATNGKWMPGDPAAAADGHVDTDAPFGFVYPGSVAYTTSNGVPVISKDILEVGSVKIVLPPCIITVENSSTYFKDGDAPAVGNTVYLYIQSKQYVLTVTAGAVGTTARVVGTVLNIEGNYVDIGIDPSVVKKTF